MSISNMLKNFLPLDLMFRIKYRNQYNSPRTLKQGNKKRIYFVDAPDYANIGDQAIAFAIRRFAMRFFPDYEFVEILQRDLASYLEWLKNNIRDQDVIFLTGGGNMGNYYRIYEATRRIVVSSFKKNRVVIFPQSIMYTNDIWGRLSKTKSQKIYNSNPNLLVLARERYSYLEMKKIYRNVMLCPDIVLSLLGSLSFESVKREECIGLCLRDDIEQKLSLKDHSMIKSICKESSSRLKQITTISDQTEITAANREIIVVNKIKEIASCNVLVTDRLHAMIFAAISSTPCVIFQNNNAKIKGTFSWLKSIKQMQLIEHTDELKNALVQVSSAQSDFSEVFDYSAITNIIKRSIHG